MNSQLPVSGPSFFRPCRFLVRMSVLLALAALAFPSGVLAQITQILDSTGDGANALVFPFDIATDGAGNIVVTDLGSSKVFKIPACGPISVILDSTGDGQSAADPLFVAMDSAGNAFVSGDDNAFKITAGGVITEIIDASGDGSNALDLASDIETDASGNVFVAGSRSDNVFKITPGGVISQIIGPSGDGVHSLDSAGGLATDAAGNVFVSGSLSDNVFKITPAGVITEIIDGSGDGTNALGEPFFLTTDDAGNVFVGAEITNNVFKISPGGTIIEVLDATGGAGTPLVSPGSMATDAAGNLFVAHSADTVFQISPGGVITTILDATGDGINAFSSGGGVVTNGSGNLFVVGVSSSNVFSIGPSIPAGFCCPAAPSTSCETGFGKGVLVVNEKKTGKERLVAKLLKGPALGQSDLGDPTASSAFAVCLYDDVDALVGSILVDRAGQSCGKKPCWKSLGGVPPSGKGYLYKDKVASSSGVRKLLMKGGDAGKSKAILVAGNNSKKGQASLPTGIAAALAGSSTVQVQLHGSHALSCYAKTLTDIKVKGLSFKAK